MSVAARSICLLVLAAGVCVVPDAGADEAAEAMAASRPPSWIVWLGWSPDGTRIAWRQGPMGTGNVPGRPVWIARLNPVGAVLDRYFRRTEVKKALRARGIRHRVAVAAEQVTAADVVVRTRAGGLYAVAIRGAPPRLIVMRRRADGYQTLARKPVLGPATTLRAFAEEEDGGRLMALVVHTGRALRRQASLFIVPLQPAVKGGDPTATLPPPATPAAPAK